MLGAASVQLPLTLSVSGKTGLGGTVAIDFPLSLATSAKHGVTGQMQTEIIFDINARYVDIPVDMTWVRTKRQDVVVLQ